MTAVPVMLLSKKEQDKFLTKQPEQRGPINIRPTDYEGGVYQLTYCGGVALSDDDDESHEELEEIINVTQEKLSNSSFFKRQGEFIVKNQKDHHHNIN